MGNIKYAVLEVREAGSAVVDYDYVVVGYIVSKCYVCEETIENNKKYYKVVFPYRNYDLFKKCEASNIEYNLKSDEPKYNKENELINYSLVSNVFDNYEDAFDESTLYNNKLLHDLHDSISRYGNLLKDAGSLFDREFHRDLINCFKFEEKITELTENMSITLDTDETKQLKR